jgi:hypothetical protein
LARYRPLAFGPEAAARTPAHNFGRDTVADYPAAMMIANCKRSKRSSACRLENFSLTGWTRARGSG